MASTPGLVVRLAILFMFVSHCLGQGLDISKNKASLGSSQIAAKWKATYEGATVFLRQYSKASVCSTTSGSLCASQGVSKEQRDQLRVATSPPAYDSRNRSHTGGFSAVGPVKDQQECNSCVSFTVLAAAQTAMACALKRDATSKISEKDFFFCKSPREGEIRTCDNSWNMLDGILAWISLTRNKNYPVTEDCMGYYPDQPCAPTCNNTDSDLSKGSFSWKPLVDILMIQDWIRTHGSVATRLDVYSDFKDFFNKNPNGVYKGPGPGAVFEMNHAVALVGYDITADPPYWIVKNSWGQNWGDRGYCKVAFNQAGVGTDGDTFGIKFNLYNDDGATAWVSKAKPSISRPGCVEYRATSSDYVWKVAKAVAGEPDAVDSKKSELIAQRLLLENKGVIKSPNMWLDGVTLTFCSAGQEVPAPQAPPPKPVAPPPSPKPVASPPPPKPIAPPPVQQQQPSAPPQDNLDTLYWLLLGTYQGGYTCDGKQGAVNVTTERDDKRNVGQVRMSFAFSGFCDFSVTADCNVVTDGTGTWCTGQVEPWLCRVESVAGNCGEPSTIQLCYNRNGLYLKGLQPSCDSASGSLKLG